MVDKQFEIIIMEFVTISTTSSSFKILKRVALVWQSARRPAAVYWVAPLEAPLRAWEGRDGGCNDKRIDGQ